MPPQLRVYQRDLLHTGMRLPGHRPSVEVTRPGGSTLTGFAGEGTTRAPVRGSKVGFSAPPPPLFLSEKLVRLDDCFRFPLGHFLKFYSQMLHLVRVIFREEFFIFFSDSCRAIFVCDP